MALMRVHDKQPLLLHDVVIGQSKTAHGAFLLVETNIQLRPLKTQVVKGEQEHVSGHVNTREDLI